MVRRCHTHALGVSHTHLSIIYAHICQLKMRSNIQEIIICVYGNTIKQGWPNCSFINCNSRYMFISFYLINNELCKPLEVVEPMKLIKPKEVYNHI